MSETLTIERLEASPGLDGPTARGVKIAPDGARVTFLRGREDDRYQLDLWEYHVADGERRLLVDSTALLGAPETLDEVEKARRERQRIFFRGIIEYDFAPAGDALLFPLGGDLYYLPLGGEPRRLTETEATETDARVSPAGGFVSFVRDQNLFVVDLASGEERALSSDGGGTVSYGMAEFVAQEEMYRFTGYWWSPDDRYVAFTRVDESGVTLVNRYEIGADGVTTVPQRYPFAGETNATVTLHLLDLRSGELREIPFDASGDDYLVRVDWSPDGTLTYQRQSRNQQRLDLMFVDPATLEQRPVLTERSDTWINLPLQPSPVSSHLFSFPLFPLFSSLHSSPSIPFPSSVPSHPIPSRFPFFPFSLPFIPFPSPLLPSFPFFVFFISFLPSFLVFPLVFISVPFFLCSFVPSP